MDSRQPRNVIRLFFLALALLYATLLGLYLAGLQAVSSHPQTISDLIHPVYLVGALAYNTLVWSSGPVLQLVSHIAPNPSRHNLGEEISSELDASYRSLARTLQDANIFLAENHLWRRTNESWHTIQDISLPRDSSCEDSHREFTLLMSGLEQSIPALMANVGSTASIALREQSYLEKDIKRIENEDELETIFMPLRFYFFDTQLQEQFLQGGLRTLVNYLHSSILSLCPFARRVYQDFKTLDDVAQRLQSATLKDRSRRQFFYQSVPLSHIEWVLRRYLSSWRDDSTPYGDELTKSEELEIITFNIRLAEEVSTWTRETLIKLESLDQGCDETKIHIEKLFQTIRKGGAVKWAGRDSKHAELRAFLLGTQEGVTLLNEALAAADELTSRFFADGSRSFGDRIKSFADGI